MAEHPITERQSYWLNHINTVDAGGESRVDYAKRQGLKVKDLYQWKTRLTKLGFYEAGQTVSDFVAVKRVVPKVSTAARDGSSYALVFPNGIRFEFEGSVSPQVIREVVKNVSTAD